MNKCSKCGSTNISYQVTSKTKSKRQGKGLLYWITIGWILEPLMWLFLTIPMLILSVFRVGKKNKIVTKNYTVAVCQDCGYTRKV